MPLSSDLKNLKQEIETSSATPGEKAALAQKIDETRAAYVGDSTFYRAALFILGGIALIVVIAVTALLFSGISGFDALIALASASIGALVGLFAPSPIQS